MWGWRELSWVWMLSISQLSCLQKAYVDFKKLSNCPLQMQRCIARAVWWQPVTFLISLPEHKQGRALAIPRTAFVPCYNMGLISLFYVGSLFQGSFVIPWEMLHRRVLTCLVSPHFASCSIPDLPFVHVLRWVSASMSKTLEMCLLQHAGLYGTGINTVFYWISFNLESVGGFMPSVCL